MRRLFRNHPRQLLRFRSDQANAQKFLVVSPIRHANGRRLRSAVLFSSFTSAKGTFYCPARHAMPGRRATAQNKCQRHGTLLFPNVSCQSDLKPLRTIEVLLNPRFCNVPCRWHYRFFVEPNPALHAGLGKECPFGTALLQVWND